MGQAADQGREVGSSGGLWRRSGAAAAPEHTVVAHQRHFGNTALGQLLASGAPPVEGLGNGVNLPTIGIEGLLELQRTVGNSGVTAALQGMSQSGNPTL